LFTKFHQKKNNFELKKTNIFTPIQVYGQLKKMTKTILKEVIYVDDSKCVNCHACITACSVKYCNDGSKETVQINSDMCIACGSCILACTHDARTYIDDFTFFINDIIAGEKIIAISAPSVAASFPNMYLKLNTWLKQLGVEAVFDVSFGAELTIKSYVDYCNKEKNKTVISQPCPAIVSYIELYQPELIPYLAPVDSPMLHTAKMIKEYYTKYKDHKIAVISPCLAKKREFDDTGMCDYNIAQSSIKKFIENNNINLNNYPETGFDNPDSERAVLFSSPGGLLKTVERWSPDIIYESRKIEGPDILYRYFEELPELIQQGKAPKLIDCLNCDFGCNAGPMTPNINKHPDEIEYFVNNRAKQLRQKYLDKNKNDEKLSKKNIEETLNKYWKQGLYKRTYTNKHDNVKILYPTKSQLQDIYKKMHKYTDEDIKNCSSCGYGRCERMAIAILNNLNRPENCHFYLETENENTHDELITINEELEQRVKSRTVQLDDIIEELQASQKKMLQQNEELFAQRNKIEEQYKQIEISHKNITDSIDYAKTIQDALLTRKKLIDSYLDNYFLLYKPKEHIGGDFYYFNKIDKYIIFAAADCTGHSVPGAFITILGITYLHEIVKLKEIDNPGKALNLLRERFKRTFIEFGTENNNGLDIALCEINTETNVLQYAGA